MTRNKGIHFSILLWRNCNSAWQPPSENGMPNDNDKLSDSKLELEDAFHQQNATFLFGLLPRGVAPRAFFWAEKAGGFQAS